MSNCLNFLLEVVLKTEEEEIKILPKRRIVEHYRMLSKDFEYHTKTSEAIVQLAILKLMFNRLEK